MNTENYFPGLAVVGFAIGAFLAGCASSSSARSGPYVKPGLVMIPADQVKYYQSPAETNPRNDPPPGLPAIDTRSVQTDSQVTAIQFNRYADPARPNELMHEAHIVYRREAGPRWRLTAPTGEQQILIGPQMTDGRGEIKGLVAPEVDAYLREQRATLRRQEETISRITEALRQMADQQKQLAEQLARSDRSRHENAAPTESAPKSAPPAQSSSSGPSTSQEQASAPTERESTEIPER